MEVVKLFNTNDVIKKNDFYLLFIDINKKN